MNFEFGSIQEGVIAQSQFRGTIDPQKSLEATLATERNRVMVDACLSLSRAYLNQQPIYARVTQGARKGSIVKIGRDSLQLDRAKIGSNAYSGKTVKSWGSSEDGLVLWHVDQTWSADEMVIKMASYVRLISPYTAQFQWDDRAKSVAGNSLETESLVFLPDYQGPTKYLFERAPSMSKAEKAALASANAIAITPLDMFGQKLALDDMFIYARRDELVIARLKKVSENGYVTAQTILDGKMVKLQGQEAVRCIRNGEPVMSLMRFERNENLTQKLMLEKLRANRGGDE